ncbi:MAG: choline-sulfatase [Gammaproteobacteria bacterium]
MPSANILIIMVDQMSGTLLDRPLVDAVHMPNIRKLMARGTTFTNAYSSSPLCTPARGSFMTGQLPSRNGIYDNAAEFTASTPTFAHYLRTLGYHTALSGKMHFVGPDQLHGFEERLTTDIYPADFGWTPDWTKPLERVDWWYHNLSSVTDAGVAQITNQLEFDDDVAYHAKLKLHQYARRLDPRPFCLTVSFTHPHDPYVARQKYWDLYEHENIPMPAVAHIAYEHQDPHSQRLYDAVDHTHFEVNDAHVRNARHAYFANVSYLDDKIGELLNVLDECDFADNTHILLCSDHGDMLGERGLWYKMSFFESSCRIPFVFSAAQQSSSAEVHEPVTTHDVLPTVVELAGGSVNDLACSIDGESVLPLTERQCQTEGKTERTAYSEYCAEGSVAPMVMIRRGDYKYVYCPADPPQLFNLSQDPQELSNLAGTNDHAAIENEFRQEVSARWDFERFERDVKLSQSCRQLVNTANRKGRFTSWDFQPVQNSRERFMRNHLDLNEVEVSNRYPKK